MIAKQDRELSNSGLKIKMELDYLSRKFKYDQYVEDLERQRKAFYEANPDFPYKTMFMNVIAPPVKFTINFI